MTQLNRAGPSLARVIERSDWHPRLLNGSDYPLPGVMPLYSIDYLVSLGFVPPVAAPVLKAIREHNPLLFDFVLKRHLASAQLPCMPSTTHIVPLLVGDPYRCKRLSDELLDRFDIYAQPINYPTVPRGTERLRLTPTPLHGDAMMARLVEALKSLWTQREPQAA